MNDSVWLNAIEVRLKISKCNNDSGAFFTALGVKQS